MDTVLNFQFPELSGNFSFSSRVVFCGVGYHLILFLYRVSHSILAALMSIELYFPTRM